ncbi:hypothetical protein C1N77_06735 [Geobacillus thermoleovorans]
MHEYRGQEIFVRFYRTYEGLKLGNSDKEFRDVDSFYRTYEGLKPKKGSFLPYNNSVFIVPTRDETCAGVPKYLCYPWCYIDAP